MPPLLAFMPSASGKAREKVKTVLVRITIEVTEFRKDLCCS